MLYANKLSGYAKQWEDAKLQHLAEKAAWPYQWVTHPLYQAGNRSQVRGRLLVADSLKPMLSGADAWVGLAPPTNASDPRSGGNSKGGTTSTGREQTETVSSLSKECALGSTRCTHGMPEWCRSYGWMGSISRLEAL